MRQRAGGEFHISPEPRRAGRNPDACIRGFLYLYRMILELLHVIYEKNFENIIDRMAVPCPAAAVSAGEDGYGLYLPLHAGEGYVLYPVQRQ